MAFDVRCTCAMRESSGDCSSLPVRRRARRLPPKNDGAAQSRETCCRDVALSTRAENGRARHQVMHLRTAVLRRSKPRRRFCPVS